MPPARRSKDDPPRIPWVPPVKVSVILPAYNEERTIRRILDAVEGVDLSALPGPVALDIIVVDDASRDRTADVAAADPRVRLLRHPTNRGKGAAIRTGLAHAAGDVVIVQDADMEYSVEDYPALLRPFFDTDAQVVYGSRFLARRWPAGMRLPNYLANRLLTLAANLLYQARLTDEATCYKVFRTEFLRSLPLRADGFDFCPEVTALARRRGARIIERPVAYAARSRAEGKKVRWTHGIQALWTLLAWRVRPLPKAHERKEAP